MIMRGFISVEPNPGGSLWFFISSGDGDEYHGCRLSIAAFRRYISLRLPPIIKPEARKVEAKSWDAATVARLGRDWYWDYTERQYGFSLCDNHLSIKYGRASNDSSTEQYWGCFLPWAEWRFIRFSLYDLHGDHVWTQHDSKRKGVAFDRYEEQRKVEASLPKAAFRFKDYDGEEITATTHIEEREWLRGTKWYKWLSWFYAPKVKRSLDIQFSAETGRRKGSWKGGTLGHGIEMLPGELHESAFKRYCSEREMTFIGRIP